MRPAKTQISLGIHSVDIHLCCMHEKALCPWLSQEAQGRLWSDWMDAQANLSLCWEHRSFCLFCCAVPHFQVKGCLVYFMNWDSAEPTNCHVNRVNSDQPAHLCSLSKSSLDAQWVIKKPNEPRYDKTNKMSVCPRRLRSACTQWPKLSSRGQRRLWSDWADAQADLSLRWAHSHFVGFVMSQLKSSLGRQGLDCTAVLADLSRHWVFMSFGKFCCDEALYYFCL